MCEKWLLHFKLAGKYPFPRRISLESLSPLRVTDALYPVLGLTDIMVSAGHSPPYEAILRAHISSSLVAFEKQQGIDDYKTKYLKKIRHFFHTCLHKIPNAVEHLPIATMHYDMGPHNMIVSSDDCSDIKAIIDWEFVGSAPFASLDRTFEMFFRKMAENGCGLEYDHTDELRKAFWDAIPD